MGVELSDSLFLERCKNKNIKTAIMFEAAVVYKLGASISLHFQFYFDNDLCLTCARNWCNHEAGSWCPSRTVAFSCTIVAIGVYDTIRIAAEEVHSKCSAVNIFN
jgi:hypothetical protein